MRIVLALLVIGVNANGCGDKRPGGLPDPGPGTCNDVGKCCDWTWPPALTSVISCADSGCVPPSCCSQAGMMVLTPDGDIHVASCCDYFYEDGTLCVDMPEKCQPKAKLCKSIGKADCDKCGARCIEFLDDPKSTLFRPEFILD